MNRNDRRKLRKRKSRIKRRLAKTSFPNRKGPVLSSSPISYEIDDRVIGTNAGGVGAMHSMVLSMGMDRAINDNLSLLKLNLPYFESDHVLSIVFNILSGGTRLEDLESRRTDEGFLNMLGAPRIPDPTTAGDFLRRFEISDILRLMDVINSFRGRIWDRQPKSERQCAIIEGDGSYASTDGEKKEDMDICYKGIWGYHPLLITLANFNEVLHLRHFVPTLRVNRRCVGH